MSAGPQDGDCGQWTLGHSGLPRRLGPGPGTEGSRDIGVVWEREVRRWFECGRGATGDTQTALVVSLALELTAATQTDRL